MLSAASRSMDSKNGGRLVGSPASSIFVNFSLLRWYRSHVLTAICRNHAPNACAERRLRIVLQACMKAEYGGCGWRGHDHEKIVPNTIRVRHKLPRATR